MSEKMFEIKMKKEEKKKEKERRHNGYSPDKNTDDNRWRLPQSIQSNRPIICLRNDGLSHNKTITPEWFSLWKPLFFYSLISFLFKVLEED